MLCVDYPPDEDRALLTALGREGLDYVPLLAPTSTEARIDAALAAAGSFVYYVSMTGITGTALADLEAPRTHVAAIRARGQGRSRLRWGSASARRPPRARWPASPTRSWSAAPPSRSSSAPRPRGAIRSPR